MRPITHTIVQSYKFFIKFTTHPLRSPLKRLKSRKQAEQGKFPFLTKFREISRYFWRISPLYRIFHPYICIKAPNSDCNHKNFQVEKKCIIFAVVKRKI